MCLFFIDGVVILSHGACQGEVEGKGGAQLVGYWAGHVVRLEGI